MDMLSGSLWDKILKFALPVALTVVLEQMFNAVDIAVLGNYSAVQTVSVAAVGTNISIVGFLVMLGFGISMGSNVVIAQSIGRKDLENVKRAVHTSALFAVFGGVLLSLVGFALSGLVLGMMSLPQEVYELAVSYLRTYLLGVPIVFVYLLSASIFRSIGQTKLPLLALVVANVVNLVLDLVFVVVLHWDVMGVALATVLANLTSALILVRLLMQRNDALKLSLHNLQLDKECLKEILHIGVPTGIQNAVFSVANVVIQGAINSLGTIVIAASSAAFPIELFAYSVFSSFSQACTTFVGQNYGARQLDRCKKILKLCLLENAIATALAVLLVLTTGKAILRFINDTPEVVEIGYQRLVIVFSAYAFSLTYDTISGYLRGFGFSFLPSLLTIIGVCGVRLYWVFFVFPYVRTFENIMLVYPVSLGITAALVIGALWWIRPTKRCA